MRNLKFAYKPGLCQVSNNVYAYLQPTGSWGLSNAGFIRGEDGGFLVDTLYDYKLTLAMIDSIKTIDHRAPDCIQAIVNTHSNGDHCNGNALFENAEIIASAATAQAMPAESPQLMASLLRQAPQMGKLGDYLLHCFGAYDFASCKQKIAGTTFSGDLSRDFSGIRAQLYEVGPAHTAGDTIVYLPDEKVVFTGDILFIEGHPILWAGPVSNWLRALDLISSLDVEAIVPGHGPITDKAGVAKLKDYFEYIYKQAENAYRQGLSINEALQNVDLKPYQSWGEDERIAANFSAIYAELDRLAGKPAEAKGPMEILKIFGLMAEYKYR